MKWLDKDLDAWVYEAKNKPGQFDSKEVDFMDRMSGITPDRSSLEARIFQRWSGYSQIDAMLQSTGIPRQVLIGKIREKLYGSEEDSG